LILLYLYISNCFSIIWINVFLLLIIGTLLAGIIGYIGGSLPLWSLSKTYEGFTGMTIFLLSMLTGGLAAMVKKAGGINYLLYQIKDVLKAKKSAQAE
jgi:predicted histidine transporter YuiF (NhaC family)